MAHGVDEKLVSVVTGAADQLQVWEEARAKVLSQLLSISNLVEQLATLKRCTQCQQLGVLVNYPGCVTRLEAKITQSAERALGYAERDKARMVDAVKRLKDLSRECQKLFEEAVELRGLEAMNKDTAQSFALSNYSYWLKEIHSAYDLDTTRKLTALEQLSYTGDRVMEACKEWKVCQPGPQGGLGTRHNFWMCKDCTDQGKSHTAWFLKCFQKEDVLKEIAHFTAIFLK